MAVTLTKRRLGDTALSLAPISLGTVKFGRNTDIKYPNAFELPSDEALVSLLRDCQDLGINLLDTAPAYGSSESRLGKLLPGKRQDWILCTKAGETYEQQASHYDYSQAAIETSVEQSLERLNTDYLDIVLIHSDGNDLDIIHRSDAVQTLIDLKAQGLIGYIGMSPKSPKGAAAAMAFSDVLMLTLNLEDQSHLAVIGEASNQGCGILLKKVFASGHQAAAESLAYVLGNERIHSAVIGTLNADHLRSNAEFASSLRAP